MEYKFNPDVKNLSASASMAMAAKAAQARASGKTIYNLSIGEPDFATPERIKEAVARALRDDYTHYVEGRGLISLRERIAAKLMSENGIRCTAENVLITPGAKLAIYAAVRALITHGDAVLVLEPSWVSYSEIVRSAGGTPIPVPLSYDNNYEITRAALDVAIQPNARLLIVNTPNNPTGRVLTQRELDCIASFALEHNLIIISDEIYEKIIFDGNVHRSLAANTDISDRVITVNGLSKCVAMTGWRVGYLAGDKALVDTIYLLYQHIMTCVSGFIQRASITAFDCAQEMADMRTAFLRRRNAFVPILNSIPSVNCRLPQGAFYAWARFGCMEMNAEQICECLAEHGVIGVPGTAYGSMGHDCVRFSLAAPEDVLVEAASIIKKVVVR